MSQEYALSRVRDAIDKEGGNHLKAQRLLLEWVKKDQTLLIGLVAPHVPSIISHAVNHVASQPDTKKSHMPAEVELVDLPPSKASQRHIDAIHILAGAGKTKKDE